MSRFLEELDVGKINLRDRLQLELKSELFPQINQKKTVYTQEFYLFIPNSLQINEHTYSKKQFYQDQTNLIRYKTPELTLNELLNPINEQSPLTRLTKWEKFPHNEKSISYLEEELKLLGNIIRSSIRTRTNHLIQLLKSKNETQLFTAVDQMSFELTKLRAEYSNAQKFYIEHWPYHSLHSHFLYLDEFISNTINYYLTGFFNILRTSELSNSEEIAHCLSKLLTDEKINQEKFIKDPQLNEVDNESLEYILYRNSLLKKYVMDALKLNTNRLSVFKRFRFIIGSFSAGIAMLFFFIFFVKQGKVFIINSAPFIFVTVFLYILKDQIKEGIRNISYHQFAKWFYDYKTDILSPDESTKLGTLRESMTFVSEEKLPKEILEIRNREFHSVLEDFKRPEQVIYYKKTISLYQHTHLPDPRRNALNLIFRFNIAHFLFKADNPKHPHLIFNPKTCDVARIQLPKVYHLNIIMKSTHIDKNNQKIVELEKFRVVLDKNGIKRVEHLSGLNKTTKD